MSIDLSMPQHSGECGHCSTAVPLKANVCTGCGARWGTVTGRSKQSIYDEGRKNCNAAFFLILISALITTIATVIGGNEWGLGILGVSFFFLILPALSAFIAGTLKKSRAPNAEVSWWRKN